MKKIVKTLNLKGKVSLNHFHTYRYVWLISLFLFLTAAGYHGSSVGIWDCFLKEKTENYSDTCLFSKARFIRSDEWNFLTPYLLSQANVKEYFPMRNPAIRSDGQNMLFITFAPVLDPSIIARPANWGFLFLPVENGFSWWWLSRLFLLFISMYELSYILTRKNILFSIICALWVGFAPAVQWWFSSLVIDLIYYSQFILVGVYYFLEKQDSRNRFLSTLLLMLSCIGFALCIYPRYQVMLAYVMILFILYFLYRRDFRISLKKDDLIFITIATLVAALIVGSVILRSKEEIVLLSNTVYPGKEIFAGGNGNIFRLNWYLTNWLLPFKENTNFFNNCVVSTFYNFLPIVFILIMMSIFKMFEIERKTRIFLYVLMIFVLFQLSILVFTYPIWFVKLICFHIVKPTHLTCLTTNLIGVYMSIIVFSLIRKQNRLTMVVTMIIAFFVATFYVISIRETAMKRYMSMTDIVLAVSYFSMLNIAFLRHYKAVFYVLFMILILVSGIYVNPFLRGLGPIYDKTITQKVLEIHEKDPDAKWCASHTSTLGNLLIALGVKSLNSTHLFPDLKMWRRLDPKGKYEEHYNRFAGVDVDFTDKETYFDGPHCSKIGAFINWKDIHKTGVSYILTPLELHNNAFKELHYFPVERVRIYKVLSETTQDIKEMEMD